MPTENRSSNTEMVSVPAAHDLAGKVRETLDRQACPDAWMVIAYEAVVKNFPTPAPQAHPEPIAWMVGTAIWWTKEEAERDAVATGLPIVGLGPMTGSADIDQLQLEIAKLQLDLTMHDAAAIQDECIRAENSELRARLDKLESPVIPELTDDLREILGRPNFTCHHIAKALRVMGLSIAPKSEDEQAVVIHWLLGIYLKHGADWRQHATAYLAEAANTLKA